MENRIIVSKLLSEFPPLLIESAPDAPIMEATTFFEVYRGRCRTVNRKFCIGFAAGERDISGEEKRTRELLCKKDTERNKNFCTMKKLNRNAPRTRMTRQTRSLGRKTTKPRNGWNIDTSDADRGYIYPMLGLPVRETLLSFFFLFFHPLFFLFFSFFFTIARSSEFFMALAFTYRNIPRALGRIGLK